MPETNLSTLKSLAMDLSATREKKKQLETELGDINGRIKKLEENDINHLMLDLGISEVTIDDLEIRRGVVFRGGVSKHSSPDAFEYLFETNNDGALKKQLVIDMDAQPNAQAVLEMHNVQYTTEYSIHHMTLSSILKELFEAGKLSTDDIEKHSIYIQPQIKIKSK